MNAATRDRVLFDRWAPRYDRSSAQWLFFVPVHVATLNAATDAGADPKVILDVGCGTGRLLERAAERWPAAQLVGIDASPQMVAQADDKHRGDPHFRIEVGDAAALPLETSSVDLAFSTVSFHHWSDQRGGVSEVQRVLRPGGLFVLADIRPPLLLRPVMRRFHGPASRRRLFENAGMKVIAQRRPLRIGGTVLVTVGRKG
ncbi:MAG TPA: methyltransferase domain-containing protein [Myxococcales bacterium]|nr:methyltransferase domain-containing protein [Myxococcales bacterium]